MRASIRLALVCVAASISAAPALAATTIVFPAGVTPRPSTGGLVLSEGGQPLYTLDLDRVAKRRRLPLGGGSLCKGSCDRLWRPVAVPTGFTPDDDWTVTPRPGGVRQLTYKGDPLYLFAGKSLAEAANQRVFPPYLSSYSAKPVSLVDGVPFSDIYWREAAYQPPPPDTPRPGGVGVKWTGLAYVFTDASDEPLYVSNSQTGCDASCQGLERLPAPLAARAVGRWWPVQATDGARYWSYGGQDVYRGGKATASGGDWAILMVN